MAEGEQNRFAFDPPTSHDENEPVEPSASQIIETGGPLAEVLDQLTEGVATLTASGDVVSWNPPAAHLTGYTISEINHRGFWRLFEPPFSGPSAGQGRSRKTPEFPQGYIGSFPAVARQWGASAVPGWNAAATRRGRWSGHNFRF